MSEVARKITLDEWDERYASLKASGLRESDYGGIQHKSSTGG